MVWRHGIFVYGKDIVVIELGMMVLIVGIVVAMAVDVHIVSVVDVLISEEFPI